MTDDKQPNSLRATLAEQVSVKVLTKLLHQLWQVTQKAVIALKRASEVYDWFILDQTVQDFLSLVDEAFSIEDIAAWSFDDKVQVLAWTSAVYHHKVDAPSKPNIPERPRCLGV